MNEKQEVTPIWDEKELAPQTHAPNDRPTEGETQTTEGNTPQKLPERPSIAPPCRHKNEGNPVTYPIRVSHRERKNRLLHPPDP